MKNKSSQSRIIILGIDGLEYSLVEKWKLKNLMQKTHCKLDLSEYDVIVTPPIWGSMITGKIDKEIMKLWTRQVKIAGGSVKNKRNRLSIIGDFIPPSIDLWIWNHIFSPLLGGNLFDKTANYVLDKKEKNIFQFFKKSWTNGIPSYGKNVSNPFRRNLLMNAISGKDASFKENVIKDYKIDKKSLHAAIKKDEYDLIFWYTMILDKLGHVYITNPLNLMNYYLEINELIGEMINHFQDSRVYIISDHGMRAYRSKWGEHSNYGFFSSNTGESINKPYELYNLITKYKTI